MPESFLALGRGDIGPIPSLVIIMLIVVFAAHLMINNMKIGKYMQATGANKMAARLAGVNTDKYKTLALVLSGIGAAFIKTRCGQSRRSYGVYDGWLRCGTPWRDGS